MCVYVWRRLEGGWRGHGWLGRLRQGKEEEDRRQRGRDDEDIVSVVVVEKGAWGWAGKEETIVVMW